MRQRARARDLDRHVLELRQREHAVQLRPRLVGRWRSERLLQTEVVNHQLRLRMPLRELGQDSHLSPAEHVDRYARPRPRFQHLVEAGMVGRDALETEHDPRPDHTRSLRPGIDLGADVRRVGVKRCNQPESSRMPVTNALAIAGVVSVDRVRRNQQRAVDADGVHRRNHFVAGHRRRTGQHGAKVLLVVAVVGVNLAIDRRPVGWHEGPACSKWLIVEPESTRAPASVASGSVIPFRPTMEAAE